MCNDHLQDIQVTKYSFSTKVDLGIKRQYVSSVLLSMKMVAENSMEVKKSVDGFDMPMLLALCSTIVIAVAFITL